MDLFYLFKDINFQKGFLLIAMFILVLVILNVAYQLSKTQGGQVEGWPPTNTPCPDYWDLSGGYCINSTNQNLGHANGEYSIWSSSINCVNDESEFNPYYTNSPIICDSGLRTIPIGTMHDKGNKMLVARDGKIKKKRQPMSRQKWANKYGFAWDGLKTKW